MASAHHVACTEKRTGTMVCPNVPPEVLGDRTPEDGVVSEVTLAFRPTDSVLVNVDATTSGLSPRDAAARAERAIARLDRQLGPASQSAGEFTEARLAHGGYITSTTAYRYKDYLAEVTATGFGPRGVLLREHFVSAL